MLEPSLDPLTKMLRKRQVKRNLAKLCIDFILFRKIVRGEESS